MTMPPFHNMLYLNLIFKYSVTQIVKKTVLKSINIFKRSGAGDCWRLTLPKIGVDNVDRSRPSQDFITPRGGRRKRQEKLTE